MRKRWRWVGAFAESLIAFAAVVEVGPATMTFWGVWDRERRRLWENTRRGYPWSRPEVRMPGRSVHVRGRSVEFDLELGEGIPIECMCPTGEGGYTWTRKLAGVSVTGEVRIGSRTNPLGTRGRGRLAGYHQRYVSWKWSAGVGAPATGGRWPGTWSRASTTRRARASGRSGSRAADRGRAGPVPGPRVDPFRGRVSAQLHRRDPAHPPRGSADRPLRLQAPFGRFSGTLNGLPVDTALGVMEAHDVVW
jgi:hypothetical protein